MDENKKYRIVKTTSTVGDMYYIQYLKHSWLFGSRWRTICDSDIYGSAVEHFWSVEEAENWLGLKNDIVKYI